MTLHQNSKPGLRPIGGEDTAVPLALPLALLAFKPCNIDANKPFFSEFLTVIDSQTAVQNFKVIAPHMYPVKPPISHKYPEASAGGGVF